MDLCILELGSRTLRLMRARLAPSGRVETVDIECERVALGESIDHTGAVAHGVSTEVLAAVLRLSNVARLRCRDAALHLIAADGLGSGTTTRSLLDAIARRTGIPAAPLSPRDTTRLAYRAARTELGSFEGRAAVVHLGDAVVSCASGTRASLDLAESLSIGVARLHRAFGLGERALPLGEANALFSLVRLCGGPVGRRLRDSSAPLLLVTSENAAAVREVALAWGFLDEPTEAIGRVALHALVTEILGASTTELENAGVGPSRAPLVGTTAVIIDAFSELLGHREVFLGTSGPAEGTALEILSRPALRLASGA